MPRCGLGLAPANIKDTLWRYGRPILQNAEGLLCPEKARFHRVGSISDHFVKRLLAAFFLNAMRSAAMCCPSVLVVPRL